MWGYSQANTFNVDDAGNCILWINTYVESFIGNHPFSDDHYMLISTTNGAGNGFQAAISQKNSVKTRYRTLQNGWVGWV